MLSIGPLKSANYRESGQIVPVPIPEIARSRPMVPVRIVKSCLSQFVVATVPACPIRAPIVRNVRRIRRAVANPLTTGYPARLQRFDDRHGVVS